MRHKQKLSDGLPSNIQHEGGQMSDLQDSIDRLEKVYQVRMPEQIAIDLGRVLEAARKVANPDYQAARDEWQSQTFIDVVRIVDAALGIREDTEDE